MAQDVIQARTGANALSGNIPAGYTVITDATITTAASVTNNGSLVLAGGTLFISSTSTFTNNGGFDTTSANGNLQANTASGGTFLNGSGGNWTIEGTLTVGSNGSSPALTNSGFLGIAPGAELSPRQLEHLHQQLLGNGRLRHRWSQYLERRTTGS